MLVNNLIYYLQSWREKMKNVTVYFFFILFLLYGLSYLRVYVKLGGGYGLDFYYVDIGTNTTASSSENYSYEAVNGSFGKGPNISS
jgi:hypothetical protein